MITRRNLLRGITTTAGAGLLDLGREVVAEDAPPETPRLVGSSKRAVSAGLLNTSPRNCCGQRDLATSLTSKCRAVRSRHCSPRAKPTSASNVCAVRGELCHRWAPGSSAFLDPLHSTLGKSSPMEFKMNAQVYFPARGFRSGAAQRGCRSVSEFPVISIASSHHPNAYLTFSRVWSPTRLDPKSCSVCAVCVRPCQRRGWLAHRKITV